jgi:membrane protease YdiL (CAAX protease family)
LKKKWRKGLTPAKLSFGRNLKFYIILSVIYFLILLFSLILNYFTGLGVPEKEFNLLSYFMTFITMFVMYGLFLWPLFFGEEFGWRVYLQDRLFPLLGGYKGVLILGIIWGVWHSGTIILGHNYPGQPILGNLAMIFGTIVMGIIFSYAVLKTGSVWIAVLLHLITDVAGEVPAKMFIAAPIDPVFSFGPGIYGTVLMVIFAIILLKSNLWKKENIPEPST